MCAPAIWPIEMRDGQHAATRSETVAVPCGRMLPHPCALPRLQHTGVCPVFGLTPEAEDGPSDSQVELLGCEKVRCWQKQCIHCTRKFGCTHIGVWEKNPKSGGYDGRAIAARQAVVEHEHIRVGAMTGSKVRYGAHLSAQPFSRAGLFRACGNPV